jgi:hypothetical protein
LYAIDTFATPKPGEALKLPKGSFKIMKADKSDEQRRKDVFDAISEMGGQYTFAGGSHYSTEEGVDSGVAMIADKLGHNVGMIHANHPTAMYEKHLYQAMHENGAPIKADWGVAEASLLSRNAILNLAAMPVWSGVGQRVEYDSGTFLA